jgi:hypothetical protein
MMRSGKGTRIINIERFKTYKVRTKLDNWGRQRCQNPNGCQQFPKGCPNSNSGWIKEVSAEVVSDQ